MKVNSTSRHNAKQWNNVRPSYIEILARSPRSQKKRSSHARTLIVIFQFDDLAKTMFNFVF
jgi:hypothetical protein